MTVVLLPPPGLPLPRPVPPAMPSKGTHTWPSGPGRPIPLCCLLRSCFHRFKEKRKKIGKEKANVPVVLLVPYPWGLGPRPAWVDASTRAAQPPGDGDLGHWLCSFPSCEALERTLERGGAILGWMCAPCLASAPWRWSPQPRRTVGSPMAIMGSPPQAAPASGRTACPWQSVTCPPGGTFLSPPVLRGADSSDSSLS